MEQGSVKWFDDAEGFCVIRLGQDGEIFVHQSAILTAGLQALQEGQRVRFATIRDLKGLQAENVQGL